MSESDLPDRARHYLEKFFTKHFGDDNCRAVLAQAALDWTRLMAEPPLKAYRGIVVAPHWLETTHLLPELDLGSWWTTDTATAASYAASGDKSRYDDSRWAKLDAETRFKVLLGAAFPIASLNIPTMLLVHYLHRGPQPFTFDGSLGYLKEGSAGVVQSITVNGENLPNHPLIGRSFFVKLDPGSDRIQADYEIHDGWQDSKAAYDR